MRGSGCNALDFTVPGSTGTANIHNSAQAPRVLSGGRPRRAVQDDPLFAWEDLCDLSDWNDEKQPAEEADTDGDHVRPITAGRIPHLLDEADPAVR
jgi:hypothetical protein